MISCPSQILGLLLGSTTKLMKTPPRKRKITNHSLFQKPLRFRQPFFAGNGYFVLALVSGEFKTTFAKTVKSHRKLYCGCYLISDTTRIYLSLRGSILSVADMLILFKFLQLKNIIYLGVCKPQ